LQRVAGYRLQSFKTVAGLRQLQHRQTQHTDKAQKDYIRPIKEGGEGRTPK